MEGQGSVGSKLLERMETNGDVTFLVGPEGSEEEIKSFVFVLSAFSNVFETQFNATWKSQQNVIKLPDIDPKIFRLFLKLVFTDNVKDSHLNSAEMDMGDILHLLYIAKKYDVKAIQSICRNAVKKRLGVKNAVLCYETLQNMDETELEKTAFDFIIAHIGRLLEEDSFTKLSLRSLTSILSCEALSVPEVPLFKGVCRWAESKCTENNMEKNGENIRKMLGDLLFLIRFPVMTIQDFFKTVQPMGILTPEEIVQISNCIALKGDSSFANNSRFSVKDRPNVKNELKLPAVKKAVKKPVLENCFTYTPIQNIRLSHVKVATSSTSSMSSVFSPWQEFDTELDEYDDDSDDEYLGNLCQTPYYELKLCILDGNRDILPMLSKSTALRTENVYFNLEGAITLEKGKSYCIYYELKVQGGTKPSKVEVKDNGLIILTQTCFESTQSSDLDNSDEDY